ncbi:MAG: type II toxin-antitoxin system RelE/ParE family toxin [Bacteroidota bacterium]|nr:type II toxin-antitoxin system RelE/ParE family toxin [Bacteroidota bacterium]
MKNNPFQIFWTHDAHKDLLKILDYYKSKSPNAYNLVKNAIFKSLSKASKNPFIFESDKLKQIEDINFRAFTVFHTRITYQLKGNKLFVLRLRHTSREPFEY